jgi:hypothetical protein
VQGEQSAESEQSADGDDSNLDLHSPIAGDDSNLLLPSPLIGDVVNDFLPSPLEHWSLHISDLSITL